MARDSDDARFRECLRLLENPYASIQFRDGWDEDLATSARSNESQADASSRKSAVPIELFPAPKPRHTQLTETPHGNPYAALADIDDDQEEHSAAAAPRSDSALVEVSKATFEAGCRRIFAQYIPRLERGRLRPEHLDFITRNRSSSAKIRSRLLEALRRYDLSDLP